MTAQDSRRGKGGIKCFGWWEGSRQKTELGKGGRDSQKLMATLQLWDITSSNHEEQLDK